MPSRRRPQAGRYSRVQSWGRGSAQGPPATGSDSCLVHIYSATDTLEVRPYMCFGACHDGPNVIVYPDKVWFAPVTPGNVQKVVKADGKTLGRLAARVAASGKADKQDDAIGDGLLIRAAAPIRGPSNVIVGVVVASEALSGQIAAHARRYRRAGEHADEGHRPTDGSLESDLAPLPLRKRQQGRPVMCDGVLARGDDRLQGRVRRDRRPAPRTRRRSASLPGVRGERSEVPGAPRLKPGRTLA